MRGCLGRPDAWEPQKSLSEHVVQVRLAIKHVPLACATETHWVPV